MEKSAVIWDDRVSDSKLRCVGKIVLLIWKYCRCYVESETLKSNTSKELAWQESNLEEFKGHGQVHIIQKSRITVCHCKLIILICGRYSNKHILYHLLQSSFSQFHLNYVVWRKHLNIWIPIALYCNNSKKLSTSLWIFPNGINLYTF